MSQIESISERASFARKENEFSIVISSAPDKKKAYFVGIILLLWLIGGGYIISNYFTLTDQKAKLMTVVWLAFWLYFTYVMGKAFTWQWSGREIIKLREGKLYYKRDTGGRGLVNNFPLKSIKNLKIAQDKSGSWMRQFGGDFWTTDCDSISFESDEKEITFGYKLSEKEKEKILKLLKKEI